MSARQRQTSIVCSLLKIVRDLDDLGSAALPAGADPRSREHGASLAGRRTRIRRSHLALASGLPYAPDRRCPAYPGPIEAESALGRRCSDSWSVIWPGAADWTGI